MQPKLRSAWIGLVGGASALTRRVACAILGVLHRPVPAPHTQRLSDLRQLRPPVPAGWASGVLDANRSSAPVVTRRVRRWSGLSPALRLSLRLAAGRERFPRRLPVAIRRQRPLPLRDAGGAAMRRMTLARDCREARNSHLRYPPRDAGGHSRGRPSGRAPRRSSGPSSLGR